MNFQKNFLIATATMLAACALTPQLHAQLAPPAPPVTASDAQDFKKAKELFEAQKWKEARSALERFIEKYKMFSPHSKDVKLMLAVASIQAKEFEMGIKQLRDLVGDKNVQSATKGMAQLTIAKALTLLAFDRFPATDTETAAQKGARKAALEKAVAEYDAFLTMFPKSKDGDSAYFLKGQALVAMGSYDLAVSEFGNMLGKFPTSPLKWDAQMWIGKGQFILGTSFLVMKDGKDPLPADVQKALAAFDNAQKALEATYVGSGDVALQNEATYYIGQMQLARSQHVAEKDDEKRKAKQKVLQDLGLQAFRAVRSVEEVVAAQEEKIKRLQQMSEMVPPGTQDYADLKKRYENLIDIEEEKAAKYKTGQDQFLAARLSIARIFLFLEKNDECRVLLRVLQMQKEAFEKDKDSQSSVAAMLCLTYAAQYKDIKKANKAAAPKCADKALEAYETFRKDFKGNDGGDNLPLLVGNVLLEDDRPDKAEEIINQGFQDYKDWRFASEALRILVGVKLKQGKYKEALELVDKVLSNPLSPDIEAETLFIKASILQKKGKEESSSADVDKAQITFQLMRDKFPKHPKAEDAWFALCQILADKDAAKAKPELEQFIAKYGGETGGLSENTKENIPLAQFLLARCLTVLAEKDAKLKEEAIKAYRKLLGDWPASEPAANALFKIFEIYKEKPDYPMCVSVMEEFVVKYPTHENVYYAYYNIAELLFTGVLNTKTDENGKTVPDRRGATMEDLAKGTLKLNSYVDYELAKGADMKVKRGDSALLRIADRWLEEMRKMPPFMTLNPEQKVTWQKCVDSVIAPVENQLKNYPKGPRLGEGLDRLVKLQIARVKAQQTVATQVETYFQNLAAKYNNDALLSSKIQAKLAEFLLEADPKRAFKAVEDAMKKVPEALKVENPADGANTTASGPKSKDEAPDAAPIYILTFAPSDYDFYGAGLFEAKRYEDVSKMIKRIRDEYPLEGGMAPLNVRDEAQAVALFWEAKILQQQGNNAVAGELLRKLKTTYPKSPKKLEADYGVILGDLERGALKEEIQIRKGLQQLADIVKISNTRTFDLQAKALFLMGRLYEELKDYDSAAAAYLKIANRFAAIEKVAGDGLWKGAQILEKQAKGEIKVMAPLEKKAFNDKAAPAVKAAADELKAEEEKLNPSKPKNPADKDAKPGTAKDAKDAKAPADKTANADAAKDAKAPAEKDEKADAPKDAKPAEKADAKPEEAKK